MGASSSGARRLVRKMAVGPSAPPMMAMAAAWAAVNMGSPPMMMLFPRKFARVKATYIPNWAAAPSRRLMGLAIRGPKSVIAPTPIKMRQGKMLDLTPM